MSGKLCAVENCSWAKKPNPNTTFHTFPKDPHLRKIWAQFCIESVNNILEWDPQPGDQICSNHFKPDDFIQSSGARKLKTQAVPTRTCEDIQCVVEECGNLKSEDESKAFYRFPRKEEVFKNWCIAIFGVPSTINILKNAVVCSDHFTPDCFMPGSMLLKPTAVPSVNIPYIMYNIKFEPTEISLSEIDCKENDILIEIHEESSDEMETEDNLNAEEKGLLGKISSTCRICFVETGEVNINETNSCNDETIASVFEKYVKFGMNLDEKLPQSVCNLCLTQLKSVHTFLLKCEHSEQYLKKLLNDETQELSEKIDVKTESDIEYNEDHTYSFANTVDNSDNSSIKSEKSSVKSEPKSKKSNTRKRTRLQQKSNLIDATNDLAWDAYKPPHRVKGPPYQCPNCDEVFKLRHELTQHRKEKKHQFVRRYACPFNCGKRYETLSKLKEHYQSHTGEKSEKCPMCDFTTNCKTSLARHKKLHTNDRKYGCQPCGKAFIRLESYKNHMRRHHNEEKLKCNYCEKTYSTRKNFLDHVKEHEGKPVVTKSYVARKTDTYQCDVCGQTLKNKFAFNVHVGNHGPKDVSCDKCEKKFTSKEKLYFHNYYCHRTTKHVCEYCGVTYKYLNLYKDHLETHFTTDSCDICNKKFLTKRSLAHHMNLHSEEAPIKCHICQKPLRSTGHLNIHLRTHTGEKPFACEVCGKQFAQKSNMQAHTKIHVSDRKFECDRCGATFKDERNCRRHKSRNTCSLKLKGSDSS